MTKKLLIAMDATNRLHVLYHGTGGNRVVELFIRQLRMIEDQYQPDWIITCFDSSPSFRKSLDSNYKKSRTKKPEIQAVIEEAKERLADYPDIPVCQFDSMEADDLLASFAAMGAECGYRVVLVTADKDCRQCLRDGVVTMAKKVSIVGGQLSLEFETASDVESKFGVKSDRWADYQAMIGDKSDDIIGVDGVGPKKAAELLDRLGSLDEIVAQPTRCPVSKRQLNSLVKFQSRAETVRQLVTLRTDLEVGPWLP